MKNSLVQLECMTQECQKYFGAIYSMQINIKTHNIFQIIYFYPIDILQKCQIYISSTKESYLNTALWKLSYTKIFRILYISVSVSWNKVKDSTSNISI